MQQVWMWNECCNLSKIFGCHIIPLLKEISSRNLVVVGSVWEWKFENFWLSHHPLVERKFRPEIYSLLSAFDVVCLKRWGYLHIIWSLRSHVNLGPRFEFHRTLAIGIRLCLIRLTSQSMISTSSPVNRSCSSTWISSSGITSVSCDNHFFRFETWNTLWTPSSSARGLSRYAGPICFRISNGPIYRGFSLPLFPKRITSFHGDTFRRTLSPNWNSKGFRRLSAKLFWRSWAVTTQPRAWLTSDSKHKLAEDKLNI